MIPMTREHSHLAGRQSVAIADGDLARFDLVLVVTDHRDVDYRRIADHAKLIIDTRNVFGRLSIVADHILKA